MIQDIFPHVYHNEFCQKEIAPEDYLFVFQGDRVLACREADGSLRLPRMWQLQDNLGEVQISSHLFTIDDDHYYLWEGQALTPFGKWEYIGSVVYRNLKPQMFAFACGAAESLHRWREANQFCGRCGSPMGKSSKERALVCPACGNTVYPKICPAVIVAVVDGDRILLTQYAGRRNTKYALIAGYAEIGEGIEKTVAREVMEEVGLEVEDLRFYKSQPWTFTDTLLMGFFVRLRGSSQIRLQEDELAMAQWFYREEIPADYSQISLTGEMITQFKLGLDPFHQAEEHEKAYASVD